MEHRPIAAPDKLPTVRIVAIYALFGAIWILASDLILGRLVADPELLAQVAACKGLSYVLVTSALLYLLIRAHVRRLNESARRAASSEERFHAIYDAMLEAVLIIDPATGSVANLNRSCCELFGCAREELLQMQPAAILGPEFAAGVPADSAAQPAAPLMTVRRLHRKDGSLFWAELAMRSAMLDGTPRTIVLLRDVSERVESEQQAAFFRSLVENTGEPLYVLRPDQEWRMAYANKAACSHYGFSLTELQRQRIPDWDPDFDMESIEDNLQRLKQGESLRFETRHRHASGELVPVEVSANYLVHDGIEYVVGSFHDISERKRTEEALRNSEGRLRTLVCTLPDLVWLKDKNGVYLSCNPMFERFFGAREADIVGKTDYDFVDRELADFFVENDRRAMAAGKPTCNEEWITFADDGRRAFLETIKTPMYDNDGELIGVLGIGRDFTRRKQAEEELRESEARYRGLVELFPEALYIHTGGKLVFVNQQGAKLLGAERPESLYGREALDFIHPDYREFVRERIERAFRTGVANPPAEQVFLRVDGTPVPVEVASVAFDYRGEKALQVIARDISERQERLREQLKAQKLESLGILAGGIAHDFNNILTGILGNLSLLRMALPDGQMLMERITRCERAVGQATGLACQLLTFARGGEPVKRVTALAGLITEAVSFALRGSNVAGRIELADDLWQVEADECQLNQVLHNLLINADQAMPGGGTVHVEVRNVHLAEGEVVGLAAGRYVELLVADQGPGIPAEHLDRIFDPYFTTKGSGTGLGLTSAYSIIKKHGGTIMVKSQPGCGAGFHVYLPACDRAAPPEPAEPSQELLPGGGRVLVMDDEELIRDLAREMLELLGYSAESCSCGEEAVEWYHRELAAGRPPDAVIMDLTIPGKMGGLEAAQKILQCHPQARLIVASGYANDPIMANYRRHGFADVLMKPFRIEDLSAKLKAVTAVISR